MDEIKPMKLNIEIIKRDNRREPFDAAKIARVVRAAGLTPEQTTVAVESIEHKLQSKHRKSVHSSVLKDIVLAELEKVSEYAAGLYKWYQETKTR